MAQNFHLSNVILKISVLGTHILQYLWIIIPILAMGVDGNVILMSMNVAIAEGETVILPCSAQEGVAWITYSDSKLREYISTPDGTSPSYRLIHESDEQYYLSFNATKSSGQTYECNGVQTGKTFAKFEVIVLDVEPKCIVIIEKHHISASCSINFTGSWKPTMQWKRCIGDNICDVGDTDSYVHPGQAVISSVSVLPNKMSEDHSTPWKWQCLITFIESGRPFQATGTNVPEYNYTWSSEWITPGERQNSIPSKDPVEINRWPFILSHMLVFCCAALVFIPLGFFLHKNGSFKNKAGLDQQRTVELWMTKIMKMMHRKRVQGHGISVSVGIRVLQCWFIIMPVLTMGVDGNVTLMSMNVAIAEGETVILPCSAQQEVAWIAYVQGASLREYISTPDGTLPLYRLIHESDEQYDLSFNATKSSGQTYQCVEVKSGKLIAEFGVIVLDVEPNCIVVINKHNINASCSINYTGNWAPTMQWLWFYGVSISGVRDIDLHIVPGKVVTSTVSILPNETSKNHLKPWKWMCVITFDESGRLSQTTGSNVPDYNYTWSSEWITYGYC